jgi:Mn2+/Fe2+ NRAMP family transporter
MSDAKKNILFIAAITLLLLVGTTIVPMQSYADDSILQKHKAVSDLKHDILQDMQLENASQHLIENDSLIEDDN